MSVKLALLDAEMPTLSSAIGQAAPAPDISFGKTDGPFDIGAVVPKDKLQIRPYPRLATLLSAHKACLARLRERTDSTFENEMAARWQIIIYKPRDRGEALERLGYLFAVVATANDWLDEDEMKEFLTMVRSS